MQQRPDSIRTQRTQPALPRMTMPTAPVVVAQGRPFPPQPQRPATKRSIVGGMIALFSVLGVLLALAYASLFPLFALAADSHDAQISALLTVFPWLPRLYWSNALPFLVQLISLIPWLNPIGSKVGNANLQLLTLLVATLWVMLAAVLGRTVTKERISPGGYRALFATIFLFSLLFGSILLIAPVGLNALSQSVLSYALYGRIAVLYHANPYAVAPLHSVAATSHDNLLPLLGTNIIDQPASIGPLWLHVSGLVVLLSGTGIAHTLLTFRLLGLLVHLTDVVVLWFVVTKFKPEARIWMTVLYAWNPLVLLFSIPFLHLEAFVVLPLLLAVLLFQRSRLTLGWLSLVVTALLSPLYLLLLPLSLRLMVREVRIMRIGRRSIWWFGILWFSALLFIVAYAPYWSGWGVTGFLGALRHTFLSDTAVNSLDGALLHLPVPTPAPVQWLVNPHHWSVFALIVIGIFLLFTAWLADTLTLLLLFSTWILLLAFLLLPQAWPWYLVAPLALTLCSANTRTMILTLLLCFCGLFVYYSWLWPSPWLGLGLVTSGLPLLLWGWMQFFASTWQMTRPKEEQVATRRRSNPSRPGASRPPWGSRPSRPGRSRF